MMLYLLVIIGSDVSFG